MITFDEVEIILWYKDKIVDDYKNTLILGKIPKTSKQTLEHNLSNCVTMLEGATEFPGPNNTIWKRTKIKQSKTKKL